MTLAAHLHFFKRFVSMKASTGTLFTTKYLSNEELAEDAVAKALLCPVP